MKKFNCLLSLLIAVTLSLQPVWAERISQEDADLVANHFMNPVSSAGKGQKAPTRRMVRKATAEPNQYYIYENANGEGWVIVAANDVVSPILAYSETGTFRTDNLPENIQKWMGNYNQFIQRLETADVQAGAEALAEWNALRTGAPKAQSEVVVGPLVTAQWDQDEPYDLYTPGTGKWGKNSNKSAVGCVATAMAQIMYYWKWPVKGTGSHTYQPEMDLYDENGNYTETVVIYEGQLTANFGETTYDWAHMKNQHSTSDSQVEKEAVATLMYHCGISVDMQYGSYQYAGSGAYTINYGTFDATTQPCSQNALWTYFGYKKDGLISYYRDGYKQGGYTYYNKWTDSDWTAMIKAELDKQHPILYDGAGDEGGHSFICDGYRSDNYFHFNWGWSGSNDGYYKLSSLVPGSGGAGGGGYDFSEDQGVIIGIEPDIKGHTVLTNGTGCTISCANIAENSKEFTATITPTDATYDFTSLTVKLGSTTLQQNTHYTLSADNKTLTIKASAITGENSDNLTITAVWTKNRYAYALLGENCTPDEAEGTLAKNAALNLTILPASGYTLNDAACWDVEMAGNTLTFGTGFTYDASNGAFAIASVTGDVNIFIYGGKEVTWKANGTTFATTLTSGDKYVLPAGTPDIDCGDRVFYGWCATENYSSETTAPKIIKNGDAADQGYVLYAVFAVEGEGGAKADSTTFDFAKIAAANSWVNSQAYTTVTIDPVTVTAQGGGNNGKWYESGDGSWRMYAGGTVRIEVANGTVTYVASAPQCDWTYSNGVATFSPSTTTKYTGIVVHYTIEGAGVAYSDFSTTCTAPEPVYYTIRFFNNGTQIGEDQSVLRNQQAQKPTDPTPACADYTFVGWWTEALAAENTEAKEWITNFKATKDQDYYAIFSKTETSEGSGSQATLDITKQGYSNGAEAGTKVIDGVTFVFDKGTNNSNLPKYYSSSDCIHMYPNNTLTISAESAITSLEYTFSRYDGWTAYPGTWDETTKTWTGEDTSIKFTVNSATGSQVRISKIVATIGTGSSSTTYYSSFENCQATGMEQKAVEQSAIKAIRNGQLVIIRGNEVYNVTGIRIQ